MRFQSDLVYVQEVLGDRLVKLAQENSVVRSTDCLDMTIAVDWDIKKWFMIFAFIFTSFGICLPGSQARFVLEHVVYKSAKKSSLY